MIIGEEEYIGADNSVRIDRDENGTGYVVRIFHDYSDGRRVEIALDGLVMILFIDWLDNNGLLDNYERLARYR